LVELGGKSKALREGKREKKGKEKSRISSLKEKEGENFCISLSPRKGDKRHNLLKILNWANPPTE